jgi:hypothetical protein
MRYIFIVLLLSACASKPQPYTLTLEQLRELQVTQADCARIDLVIQQLEHNQLEAGIPPTPPEQLAEPAREYQARTRAAVWALRIGCENPDRYVVK